MKKNICVVTGSRAEYGLLSNLLFKLKKDGHFNLQIIVTGMHLSTEFGKTFEEINKDGLKIDKKIECILSSDTPNSICKSTGIGFFSFGDAYEDLKPDIIVLLGDRYELFAAAFSALVYGIPIAHIHGGELTSGAFDDAIRHSITKMSWLHFTSTDVYKKRIIQMGESPLRVFNVGGLGAEKILNLKLFNKKNLEKSLNFLISKKLFLVTFHSTTLEMGSSNKNFKSLLKALDHFKDFKIIFTLPNADTDGRIIIELIKKYASLNPKRVKYFTSLGQKKYFSLIKFCHAVIGNSSSGLLEVPSFKTPTINIGERQKGRVYAKSVINCEPTKNSIIKSILKTFNNDFIKDLEKVENPYYGGNTSKKIIEILKKTNLPRNLKKKFYDIGVDNSI